MLKRHFEAHLYHSIPAGERLEDVHWSSKSLLLDHCLKTRKIYFAVYSSVPGLLDTVGDRQKTTPFFILIPYHSESFCYLYYDALDNL